MPILDQNALIYIPYARVNCLKTIPFTAAHTHIIHIWQCPPPGFMVYQRFTKLDVPFVQLFLPRTLTTTTLPLTL